MEQTDSIDEREFEAAFHESVANGSCIKWRYWVHQMPNLTAEQAARLMCGLDPDLFESLNSRPNRNDPADLCQRARMIERLAIAEKHLADSPAGWLAWAKSRGFNVHDGFVLEVEAQHSAQVDQEQSEPSPAPASAEQVDQSRSANTDVPVPSGQEVFVTPRPRKKRKTWKDAAWGYVVQVQREGRYRTCNALFNALEDKGSEQGAPIIKGAGDKHRGRLFVVEIGESYELKTFQNAWPEIREAAEGE